MSVYYPTGCDEQAMVDYQCSNCLDFEYGRIRHGAIISLDYMATLLANPTSAAVWTTGIDNRDIYVLYQISGSYDMTTSEGPGFGALQSTTGQTTHSVTFKDPNYTGNSDFFNALRGQTNWGFAYCSETQVHFSEVACSFAPKAAIADDLSSVVTWEVLVKWINQDSPTPYTFPASIFSTCYMAA